jgi:hypothetical protein
MLKCLLAVPIELLEDTSRQDEYLRRKENRGEKMTAPTSIVIPLPVGPAGVKAALRNAFHVVNPMRIPF